MAFCSKCGKEINDGQKFCPGCGAPADGSTANATKSGATPTVDLSDRIANFTNTADTTSEFAVNDIQENKVFAILAYLGILFIVPLLAAPNSKFARYHANQGSVLFITLLAVLIVSLIFGLIPVLGIIIRVILYLCFLTLLVIGIVNAAQGKAKELPLIGGIKLFK
mgnify:CR=1 FL=1